MPFMTKYTELMAVSSTFIVNVYSFKYAFWNTFLDSL